MPAIGEVAPDFEALTDEGKPLKLSDLRGKKVVLYFYPKDFTSGCEMQACAFRDHYAQFEAANAVVLGVSPDDVESHQRFREALNLPFHLLVDSDFSLSKAWESYGTKTYPDGRTFTGTQRSHFVIDENGVIIDVQNPVSPQESAPRALAAVQGA
ncbi:MAG: peroxiredoxin [Candidatus Thermofonsia Clade 1 bacterium]|jgi:peroxiredoxin Q/BCP|uniref:thioredoxin-dependent peroxiredoxin n=1 Tax=Candidatus Thermofonsia Clade 1 bacterium TaxID=2364210 RepID=A0A2M8P1U5_9CHLR|nr:MAG: peroxiredoxin [Candidatus Thermofonsia Clade 1 bacterium]